MSQMDYSTHNLDRFQAYLRCNIRGIITRDKLEKKERRGQGKDMEITSLLHEGDKLRVKNMT